MVDRHINQAKVPSVSVNHHVTYKPLRELDVKQYHSMRRNSRRETRIHTRKATTPNRDETKVFNKKH